VIAKGQRLGQVIRQRLETAEMRRPLLLVEVQANALRPSIVDEARLAVRKARGLNRIVEGVTQVDDAGIGQVGNRITIWRLVGGSARAVQWGAKAMH